MSDIQPFARFAQYCEREGIATENQLRWWARYRRENGLLSSGAISEMRANPGSKRPQLFVIVPRFVSWLATDQKGAV
jgi:hypothetical protein